MRRTVVLLVGLLIGASPALADVQPPGTKQKASAVAAYKQLPLAFEENRGQTDPAVAFISRGDGYTVFLTSTEAVVTLRAPAPQRERDSSTPRSPPPATT